MPSSPDFKPTPVLTKRIPEDRAQRKTVWFDQYVATGGYKTLEKVLSMQPGEITDQVKAAILRGRGGAGFPAGLKWSFLSPPDGGPRYLAINCDEAEPGTFKDRLLVDFDPHAVLEGIAIAAYACQMQTAYFFIRGEYHHQAKVFQKALEEAYANGVFGKQGLMRGASKFAVEVVLHRSAGAYICGEETALLDSLEGFRGQPRLRPPFPAIAGLYAKPTVVNNVESVASVPAIVNNGVAWFAAMGTEKSKGFTLYSLSGHVNNPGQFEAPLGITLRQLLEISGGIRKGHKLKFWTPGGSSTPIFTDAHLDVPLDYEGVSAAGSMLGTKALQIFDETTCIVRAVLRWTEFYKHESCGKCTPCREGTWWLVQVLKDLEAGKGTEADLDKLLDLCDNIMGRSFCALADGAASPIISSLKYFRQEYLDHLAAGRCPFDPLAATLFETAGVK